MNLAPIILFVYNRPWHTERTLEALMENEFADESSLYIYSDGPKKNASVEDLKNIKEVRTLISEKNWCKEVVIIERNENLGLANSVIKGVTEIIERHGRVIVLEDDILTGKYFLKFMNEGLETYQNDEIVYGVSGYCFPHSEKIQDKTYFLPLMSSWGYGTWDNRWNKINFNGKELLNEIISKNLVPELDFGKIQFYQMLQDQVSGKNDSWAVRFYVSMYLNNGVFLFPNLSLLKNIGFDGSGVHCKFDSTQIHDGPFDNNLKILVKKIKVVVKLEILEGFKGKDKMKETNIRRIGKKIQRLIAPEIIQLIKRKTKLQTKEKKRELEIPRYIKTSVPLDGRQIQIPDIASFRFMYKEIFEQEIYKFKTSKPEPYIIDGGANIGLATIYLKRLFPTSKIISFEPDPDIFKFLKNNIAAFNFTNVELHQKGLWDHETSLEFWSEGADGGLISDLDKTRPTSNRIETISLKPYLKRPVDFLKLDIEGAENKVLKDIQDNLDKVEKIFVEYHSFIGQPQTLNEIIDILTKAKFRLHISTPGLSSISPFMNLNVYNNMDMQLNIYGYKEN